MSPALPILISPVVRPAEELGADAEAERIVDWLRAAAGAVSHRLDDLADAIDPREYRHHRLSK